MRKFLLAMSIAMLLFSCSKDSGENPVITSINFQDPTLSIILGKSQNLIINHIPNELDTPEYKWSSSDNNIVSVDDHGKITAIAIGEATITAKVVSLNLSAICKVKVEPIKAEGIKLNKSSLELKIGEKEILTYEITPDNATDKTVYWSSENSEIASINDNGEVAGLSIGETYITIKTDGNITDRCKVTVEPIKAEKIKLSKSTLELNIGEKEILTYEITPDNTTDKTVYWSSENPEVASINNEGEIIGLKDGVTNIVIKTGDNITDKCEVTIKSIKAEGINILEESISIDQSDSHTLTVAFTPENTTNKNVFWISRNPEIVSITESGEITGIGVGKTTVTATSEDGGFTAICEVEVKFKGLTLSTQYVTLLLGQSQKISVYNAGDGSAYNYATWNSETPSIVSVIGGGEDTNSATITANKLGQTNIKATSTEADGRKEVVCYVEVREITDYVSTSFGSSSISSINGYITGSITTFITNNSSENINLTALSVYDGNTGRLHTRTTDESLLGVLNSNSFHGLSVQVRSVYRPIFEWTFTYENSEYTVKRQFDR